MPWLIVLVLIGLPVVEIALFVKSAQWIGVLPTIALAIAAGMAGVALVRRQGLETMFRARTQLDRGEFPVAEAFDGLCLAFAGALLFLPGFFSDVIALLLLLPPVRAALRLWLAGHVRTVVAAPGPSAQGPADGPPPVIEVDYRVVEDDRRP
ncbi:MAG: FxsA family protein [Pseudomonadota bacterium]